MVRLCHRDDVGLVADETDEPVGEEGIEHRERQGNQEAPNEQQFHGLVELFVVVRSRETSHQSLTCVGEAVGEVGEDVEDES